MPAPETPAQKQKRLREEALLAFQRKRLEPGKDYIQGGWAGATPKKAPEPQLNAYQRIIKALGGTP